MRFPVTVFSVMLSTKIWTPEANGGDGVYFFDRNAHVMDHVLDYMANGVIRTEILSSQALKSLKDDLDYFEVPYYEDQNAKVLKAPNASDLEHQKSQTNMRYYDSLQDMVDKTGKNVEVALEDGHPQRSISVSVESIFDKCLKLYAPAHRSSFEAKEKVQKWQHLEEKVSALAAASADQIKLEFRSRMFTTCKSTLMKTPWFEAAVSRWEADEESGAYFIDRNPRFIDLILDYLRTGKWNIDRIDRKLLPELEEELEYFNIEASPIESHCTWDLSRKVPQIGLSEDLMTATSVSGRPQRKASVIGTHPVSKVRYTILSRGDPQGNTMIGLAPHTAPLSGAIHSSCGFFFYTHNAGLYCQPGSTPASFGSGSLAPQNGEWIELEHDRAGQTIYITRPAAERRVMFQNVPNVELYPCVNFFDQGASIRIDQAQL